MKSHRSGSRRKGVRQGLEVQGESQQGLESLEGRRLLAAAVQGVGNGLIGQYFSDQNFTNLALTTPREVPSFHFDAAPFDAGVNYYSFGARWQGKIQAQQTETYTFYTQSDQPVRLWINGQQLVNNWTSHPLSENSGTISLSAGEFYDIKLEFLSNIPDSDLVLSWSSASTSKQVVPASQLYDSGGWVSQNWLDEEIGAPLSGGSALGDSTGYTIKAGGGAFGTDASDDFHFLHQTLNGDGTIIAKVIPQESYGWPSEWGVMVRESSAPGSKFVSLAGGAGGARIQFRQTTGSNGTSATLTSASGTYWLKLVRDGSFFKGYISSTGADGTWTSTGTAYVDMARTVQVGLAASAGDSTTPLVANFQNVSVTAAIPLGAGLDQVRDYSLGNVFVDVAKQMRQPQTPGFGPNVGVDATGWPTADFGSIFITGYNNVQAIYRGTYKLSFKGQATLGKWVSPATISNVIYDAATNTTTADVFIDPPNNVGNGEWNVGLQFTNTRRTPGSPLGSGVTDIKMIRPGYAVNTTQVFTNEYLAHLKQFTTLRFMDFTQTNSNPVANWSDRAQLTDARQSTDKGVAWEYVIQLANLMKKDVWINIPHMATDDYIRNLATLFKNNLNPDLTVYLEYSNEVWNGIFAQADYTLQQAISEVNTGNSVLDNDGSTNQYYWMWRRTAKRTKEMSDIFSSVYGSEAINRKVRPVLSMQTANAEVVKQELEFLDRTYGSPSNYIFGIAGAPYFGAGGLEGVPNATVDQYIQSFSSSISGLTSNHYIYHSWANRFGLEFLSYEGGPDTFGSANVAAKKAASLDPRMAGLVEQYLDGWYSQGGGLFNWFQAGPTNYDGNFGTWGLSNAIDNLTAPKILGTITVLSTPKEQLNYGIPVPATFDARLRAGAITPFSDTYLKNIGKGNSVDYFVRAEKAGTYKLVLRGGTSGSNEQITASVNTTVRTITLKNTGSTTTFADNVVGNVYLDEGMNTIRLTSVNEPSGWNLQSLTVAAAMPANGNPPFLMGPAQALPAVVNGKTTNLSVAADDDTGEAKLVYSWRAVGEAPGTVAFSANGTNAAKNTTATFTRTGPFNLEVTISDGTSSITSTVPVTVNQVVSSVAVTPNPSFTMNGGTQQFSAQSFDQYGVSMKVQPAITWSLDAGGIGTLSAGGLYTAPASGTGTSSVRATVTGTSVTSTASMIVQTPRTPENPAPAGLLPGVDYKYYQGSWGTLPNFDALTPVKSGVIGTFTQSPKMQEDNFGFVFTGFVTVPTTGVYTFFTSSDDGSQLFIGNTLVVNNDGNHGNIEKSGQIVLAAGTHAIKVTYYDGLFNDALTASYSGPGIAKQEIPASALKHTHHVPTVVTPAAATPSPATGTTTALSVLGGDEVGEAGLTYNWSVTGKPSGAADPTFSVNGTNAAKNTVATFSQTGAYTFLVTLSNGFNSSTGSVSVTVNQTVSSITVTPAQTSMSLNSQQQLTATGRDQFGQVMGSMPSLTWSVTGTGSGSVNSSGVYTAPGTTGNYTINASASGVTGSTLVQVVNSAPTVVDAATATPNPTTGTTAQLHTRGSDDGGAANLVYTWFWSSKPSLAPDPTFSVNQSATATDPVVTFGQAGTYTLTCGISDGTNTTYTQVTVTVNQRATAVAVTPGTVALSQGATQQFGASASDQFGKPISGATFTWSVSGGGSINSSGLYTAGSTGATVTATTGTASGNAQVTVSNPAPTVAQPAAADPQTGSSATVALSVLGADDGGEANLTYTWAVTSKPSGALDPTYSANGTNAAKNVIATYKKAGTYTFRVTISDGNSSVTSSVTATVQQKTTTVIVTPANATVANGAAQQFAAVGKDQFAEDMSPQPGFTWSVAGTGPATGSIGSSGLYTAPASGNASDTVTARAQGTLSGQVQGTAGVTVGQQATSIFTNEADVNSPALAGSYTFSNGTYTVRGGGADIWSWSDQFHYVYRSITGDGTIIARVTGVQNTAPNAKAGVMFREDLTQQSKQAMIVSRPDNQITFQRRITTWGDTFSSALQNLPAPYWVKLTRTGNVFTSFASPDGVNWAAVGTDTIAMNATVYVGLAVCAHDNSVLNTSTFSNVSWTPGGGAGAPGSVTATSSTTSVTAGARPSSLVSAGMPSSTGAQMNSDATTPAPDSGGSASKPAVKVNVPLVTGAGKTVVKKTPVVRVNVPTAKTQTQPRRDSDVPDVKTT